ILSHVLLLAHLGEPPAIGKEVQVATHKNHEGPAPASRATGRKGVLAGLLVGIIEPRLAYHDRRAPILTTGAGAATPTRLLQPFQSACQSDHATGLPFRIGVFRAASASSSTRRRCSNVVNSRMRTACSSTAIDARRASLSSRPVDSKRR